MLKQNMATVENMDIAACAVGVAVTGPLMEVCVMASRGDVVLHGWFPRTAALSILGDRPPCHIAFASEALPPEVVAGFQARGHAAIVLSKLGWAQTPRSGRAAADICRVALHHAATFAAAGSARAC